jgi:PucR C-terminal helix-turn-helix domain/GGDEF-like domain
MTTDRSWVTCAGAAGRAIAAGGQHARDRDPHLGVDHPAVARLVADLAAAVGRHSVAVSEDVYKEILREIPQLDHDKPLCVLLAGSIDANVDACLQIMQHQIDPAAVRAPAVTVEYARRLAQRGTPLTVLLRAYRLGHARFSDWLLTELAGHTGDVEIITATALSLSRITAGYLDQASEELVAAYSGEREHWLRNRNAARAARIRDLLSGRRISVSTAEAALGCRLRQYHVGLVCWTAAGDSVSRLEHAISHVAAGVGACGDPVFLPRDESSAWAWLPLGIRDRFDAVAAAAGVDGADSDLHFAFGDAAQGVTGFRLTHQQALTAQAVALAAGTTPVVVAFGEVAPVAMMLGSADLLRAWVLATLGDLATDDLHHARLRDTLLVFLLSGRSYKAAAEQLTLHKNTVQYRIGKAEASLGRRAGENRQDVELALRASHWLGSAVLRPALPPAAARR